jgi:hypothetical protein
MRCRIIAGAALLAALAGCSGGGGDDEDEALIGPDTSFAEADQIGEEQWNEVAAIYDAEGYTAWADVPISGTGTYRGVIGGWADGGEPVDYVADLELNVDFADASVRGAVRNMVTDHVANFTHPEGTVRLSGTIAPDEFDTGIMLIEGSGTLETNGVEARLVVDGFGDFVGTDARGILGEHETDFVWLRGPAAGTTSFSDGLFSAQAE